MSVSTEKNSCIMSRKKHSAKRWAYVSNVIEQYTVYMCIVHG